MKIQIFCQIYYFVTKVISYLNGIVNLNRHNCRRWRWEFRKHTLKFVEEFDKQYWSATYLFGLIFFLQILLRVIPNCSKMVLVYFITIIFPHPNNNDIPGWLNNIFINRFQRSYWIAFSISPFDTVELFLTGSFEWAEYSWRLINT